MLLPLRILLVSLSGPPILTPATEAKPPKSPNPGLSEVEEYAASKRACVLEVRKRNGVNRDNNAEHKTIKKIFSI